MLLSFVLYRSEACESITDREVQKIISTSARSNARADITGFLHYDHGHFLQYLEGPYRALSRKLAVIERDPRHHAFTVIAEGTNDTRVFPSWGMGRLDADLMPSGGILATEAWLMPPSGIDPLPLIGAFTAHARRQGMREGLQHAS